MLVATALALLQTYPEYKIISELAVFFIGVVGGTDFDISALLK